MDAVKPIILNTGDSYGDGKTGEINNAYMCFKRTMNIPANAYI